MSSMVRSGWLSPSKPTDCKPYKGKSGAKCSPKLRYKRTFPPATWTRNKGGFDPLGLMATSGDHEVFVFLPSKATASCSSVGQVNNVARGNFLANSFSILTNNDTAESDCPPSSKKF